MTHEEFLQTEDEIIFAIRDLQKLIFLSATTFTAVIRFRTCGITHVTLHRGYLMNFKSICLI